MPDATKYNLSHRPTSYWESPDPGVALLSVIKGDARKRFVRDLLRDGQPEDVEAWMVENLADTERQALAAINPRLMGGEFLPDFADDEVEVARVSLASVTGDVISIRARRCAGVVRYSIVDEYDSEFSFSPTESEAPLSMGELIALMDGARQEGMGKGLTGAYRNYNLHFSDAEHLVDFVTVSSEFYPELSAYYEEEAKEWLEEVTAQSAEGDE